MSDAKQAEAWHNAAVANGGTSIEDPPGVRQMALISLIFVTPIATSSSRLLGKRLILSQSRKLGVRPFRGGSSLWWTPATKAVRKFCRHHIRRLRESVAFAGTTVENRSAKFRNELALDRRCP
jgi:hypothetical protein